MKKTLCVFSVLVCIHVSAQTSIQQVVGSAGNTISSSSGSISYTVGEPVVSTISSANNLITQGFQQPYYTVSGLLDKEKEANGSFSVYPVPASDQLWFGYAFNEGGAIHVEVYDALGQKMDFSLNEMYQSGKVVHAMDCTAFAAGNYFIRVTHTDANQLQNTISKQFQILKN